MIKAILLLVLMGFFALTSSLFAQSTSKVKKLGISKVEEVVIDSLGKKTVVSKREFDDAGNIIFEEEYNKKGQLKARVKREFDKQNNITKETFFDSDNKIIEENTYEYKFENVVKSTHLLVNKGVEERFVMDYRYNGFNEKIEEIKSNSKGVVIEKTTYEYDKQSLKTKKTKTDYFGKVIEIKEYHYGFDQ